ncbi:MAG: hypothetical protein IPN42_17405 [Methylococcaceae bacterium]|nr:hypothetical protein [Methylococcaceae bacterium]
MKSNHLLMRTQSGVVLVIALILLAILSMIGVAGMQTTGLEEKMAGNMKDKNLAFQAAETALREGEAAITLLTFNCTNGRYFMRDANCDTFADALEVWDSINWSAAANPPRSVQAATNLPGLAERPRFVIEAPMPGTSSCASLTEPCPAADIRYNYRVTARAVGGSTNAVAIVQSVVQSSTPPP